MNPDDTSEAETGSALGAHEEAAAAGADSRRVVAAEWPATSAVTRQQARARAVADEGEIAAEQATRRVVYGQDAVDGRPTGRIGYRHDAAGELATGRIGYRHEVGGEQATGRPGAGTRSWARGRPAGSGTGTTPRPSRRP
jgi:hypothetical protein